MSSSTNKTSYTKEASTKLNSLKLFPKKLSNSKLHNLKLKKDNELTFTRENIKNLFGNKLTTTTYTTKNSPNSSLYFSQTTNNIEFSFSNNNNNVSRPTDQDQPNNDFNFTFQNDFTYSDINESLLQLASQYIKSKQTFNSNINVIERYLQLFEQVITLIRNYDEIKEHALLDKIYNGLKEHCALIKVKYMKLHKKYHLQNKEMCEYKDYMRKLKEDLINNNKEKDNKRVNNQGINFIDNINIFEDNSVYYKEGDVELESLYFKDKVRMKKNRSLKNINVPKLDLSFNEGKEGKCNKAKKDCLNKTNKGLGVKNKNGNSIHNNNNNSNIYNYNNQIQHNTFCFKMTQSKHRPKSKSFSMFSPMNYIDNKRKSKGGF